MDKVFWLISIPTKDKANTQPLRELDQKTKREYSNNNVFAIPDLRVGTLDSLMKLVEELFKLDTYVEGVNRKILRQWVEELKEKQDLTVGQVSIERFLTNFEWKEEKYPVKSSMQALTDQIQQQVGKIDDELRTKSTEFNTLQHGIAAAERKTSGTLMIKDLADIVRGKLSNKEKYPDTEHLTTLLVVVPKYMERDWHNSYESMAQFVVPRSTEIIDQDAEFLLFSVVMFRKAIDTFKAAARERRFTVREVKLDDSASSSTGSPPASVAEEKQKLEAERDRQKTNLIRWCKANFSEAFTAWVHLKAIRLFVESVLRYGLPARFFSMLVQPAKKHETRVRNILAATFNVSGGADMGADEADPNDPTGGSIEKFYPYVSLTLNLEMKTGI